MQTRIIIRKNRPHAVRFDDADIPAWERYRWYVVRGGRYDYMCVAATPVIDGKKCRIYFHRELCGLQRGDPLVVDHINHDPFDNCRSNIRVVSQTENKQNTRGYRVRRYSDEVGVTWNRANNCWRAEVMRNGVRTVRIFKSEAEAVVASRAMRADNLVTTIKES